MSKTENAIIDIEKYKGISDLDFDFIPRIYNVLHRRKIVSKEITNGISENQLKYAIEEIKHLDSVLKKFLFID